MEYELCLCSDTHESLPTAAPAPQALCWLHAGDFYNNRDQASAIDDSDADFTDTIGELEGGEIYQWFKKSRIPLFAVRGNHDGDDAWGFFRKARDISGKIVRLAPKLLAAGIGWHGRNYNDLPSNADFSDASSALSREILKKRKPDDLLILLTHYPILAPPHTDNPQETFAALRNLAAITLPDIIIQGHIHEWSGTHYHVALAPAADKTLVINPGAKGGILIVDSKARTAQFKPAT